MAVDKDYTNSAMKLDIVSMEIDTEHPIKFILNEEDGSIALSQHNEWYEGTVSLVNQEEIEAVIKVLTMFKDKVKKE